MKKLGMDELGRPSVEEFRLSRKLPILLLLDNVRSLHNVGSAFRTADAFACERICLTGITGQPPHREIHKTALGATESVSWEYFSDPAEAVRRFKKSGYRIVAIEQTTASVALDTFPLSANDRLCLVFGNEINGVSEEVLALADAAIDIPQAGTKHSLNIAVCVGIVCWELFRRMR